MNTPVAAAAPLRINTGPQRLIALLLLLLVLGNGYQLYTGYQRETAQQQRIVTIHKLTNDQHAVIDSIMTSYRKDAYDNASVDRIAEQQLVAAEYNLQVLQIIAQQNAQLLEVLSEAR